MSNSKKLLIAALAVIFLAGATPLAAQLAGTWEGTGEGSCNPPGTTIYPWQSWEGEIPNSEDIFTGEWQDEEGNWGSFRGSILWVSHTEAYCTGYWTWYDPSGVSKKAGDFEITFRLDSRRCEGTWTSIYPYSSHVRTIEGWKVQ